MANSTPLSRRSLILMVGTGGLLTACGQITLDEVAGADVDEGGFGNPTFNNRLAQTGQSNARISLARKFADSVPTTVNFAFDSSVIDGEGQQIVRRQADFMRQFPEVTFSVYGHTDAVGGEASNLRLGRSRARAVVRALGQNGIAASRLEALVSFGERQLLVPTQDRERANRRTVTEVSGFVQGDPLVLDGQYANLINRNYVASQVPSE
jgi:outer membrane protein OmpA-like peptidoglycan-associated protein